MLGKHRLQTDSKQKKKKKKKSWNVPIRHFQFTAYADVDTYTDTYAD